MPIRDLDEGNMKICHLEDKTVTNKEFGDVRSTKLRTSLMTWSNRENEWYNSERRMIFACASDADRKKWIQYFRGSLGMVIEEQKEKPKKKSKSRKRKQPKKKVSPAVDLAMQQAQFEDEQG